MMKKLLLLLLCLSFAAQAEVWQARYGIAETFNFKLYNADGTLDVDEADAGTEVSVSCNEGAETTATNDFADEGTFYSIALTAAELQCERIAVVIAATTTEVFFIQTSANASAMTPVYETNVATYTAGAITPAAFSTTAGAFSPLGITRQGTAQSASGTGLVLDAAAAFADDVAIGMTLVACGSTQGYCQSRAVTDNALTGDAFTVDTWTVTPSGTITYFLFGTAPSSGAGGGLDAAGVRAAVGLASANLDTQISGVQSDTNDLQTRVPTALVSGRIDASVGAVAANAITAASAASDLTTELQSGLATSAALTGVSAVTTNLATAIELDGAVYRFTINALEQAPLGGGGGGTDWTTDERTAIRAALGIPSSGTTLLDPSTGILNTIRNYIDTEVLSIKAKTDNLTFSVSGQVDANTESMNGNSVCGGTTGTPWRAC